MSQSTGVELRKTRQSGRPLLPSVSAHRGRPSRYIIHIKHQTLSLSLCSLNKNFNCRFTMCLYECFFFNDSTQIHQVRWRPCRRLRPSPGPVPISKARPAASVDRGRRTGSCRRHLRRRRWSNLPRTISPCACRAITTWSSTAPRAVATPLNLSRCEINQYSFVCLFVCFGGCWRQQQHATTTTGFSGG